MKDKNQKISKKILPLIFLAIFCQFLTSLNFYAINNYLQKQGELFIGNQLDSRYWVIACFLGRILGMCVFGVYARCFGFFKSMQAISILFLTLTITFALFIFNEQLLHTLDDQFYFFRFYYCFLQPAALFLPLTYLFCITDSSKHLSLSALSIFSVFSAEVFSFGLKFTQVFYPSLWAILPIITTCFGWGIYCYLQKISANETSATIQLESTMISKEIKILSTALGAASATAIFFNHTFLSHYHTEIVILETHFNLSGVLYYLLWFLFIIPGCMLTKQFGFFKVAQFSLGCLIFLTFNPFFSDAQPFMLIVRQVTFAICSAFFIAPMLAALHNLYEPSRSSSHKILWWTIGFSICIFIAFFEKDFSFRSGFTCFGWCVFNLSLILCLIALSLEKNYANADFLKNPK